MKTSVLITAVAGTGKTTACKTLQQLGYRARDIESIPGLYELINVKTGKIVPGNRDQIKENLDWSCNKTKLLKIVDSESTELALYCGGMANTEEVWDVFDAVVVLTVSDDTTVRRLSTRKAGEFGSTQASRDWVLSWKHDLEQRWLRMGGIAVSAEDTPEEVAKHIIDVVSGK